MNLNLDLSIVTRVLNAIVAELRQKRLWPVAAVLVAGMVAVPVLLSKSPKPAAQAVVPAPLTPPSSGTALPAISVQATPAHTNLAGRARNPFAAAAGSGTSGLTNGATTNAVSTVTSAAQNAVNAVTGGGVTPGTTTTGSTPTSTPTTPTSTPTTPSITGNAKPKPIHSGLSSTQAYDVSLSITTSQGGVDSIDPLVRLSAIPSDVQPHLIELGVLQGGSRVLFALTPGTTVTGPGTCIPGILDCEVLSLGQDQTESISQQTPNGVAQVALFAVTGITVNNYSSAFAASKARHDASASGRAKLDGLSLPTLSLFKYEPNLGSVVDLRNLTVGS